MGLVLNDKEYELTAFQRSIAQGTLWMRFIIPEEDIASTRKLLSGGDVLKEITVNGTLYSGYTIVKSMGISFRKDDKYTVDMTLQTNALESLLAEIDTLQECIMELSQELYGGDTDDEEI